METPELVEEDAYTADGFTRLAVEVVACLAGGRNKFLDRHDTRRRELTG
jgi:hypothetical protein